MDYGMLEPAWRAHVENGNDATVLDMVPEGPRSSCCFHARRAPAVARRGGARRPRPISDYVRFNQAMWQVEVLEPRRSAAADLRLTVDNPQDLIVVREVWKALGHLAPRIPLAQIVAFLDAPPT